MLKESEFIEGWSLNTFGAGIDSEGKAIQSRNRYKIFGTSINYLIKNNILSIPNYIKIDVDGIEHLILEGASDYLDSSEIKGMSIEVNENFKDQFNSVLKIMDKSNFRIKHKKKTPICLMIQINSLKFLIIYLKNEQFIKPQKFRRNKN